MVNHFELSQIKVVQEETDAQDFQYTGTKRAFLSLKDIRKEDKIDFSYTIVGSNPVFDKKYSDNFYFTSNLSVANYYLTLIAPKNRLLNIKYFNEATSSKKYLLGETRFYHWNNPTLKLSETQKSVPSWFDNYPYVSVSEYKEWKEVVTWGVSLFGNNHKSMTPALESKINEWKKIAKRDTLTYIGLATNFVQDQIRYLGDEVGIYTHQPHDPSVIFKQRYGDCKDKVFLLISILQSYGVKAFAALVNTELKDKVTTQNPSPDIFNHTIVAISNDSSYQFIDATISYQRGKIQQRFIPAYGYALVLRAGSTDFDRINPGPIKKTSLREIFYVKNKGKGVSTLQVETFYEGGSADNNRANFAENSLVEMQESYKKFYAKYYDSLEIENELVVRDDSVNNKFYTTESYRIPGIWQLNEKGKETMSLIAGNLLNLLPDPTVAYKNAPLGIGFPMEIDYTIELHMPSVWSFPADDYKISNESYQFELAINNKDSIIILNYHFKTFKDFIAPESLARYKDDYNKIENRLSYTLTNADHSTNGTDVTLGFSISWLSILYTIAILATCFFVFTILNKRTEETIYQAGTGQKIGGWLWVLGCGIILALLVNTINVSQKEFYNANLWSSLSNIGGEDLRWLQMIEEFISFLVISFEVAMAYWFFKRRDIFPKMFIHFILTLLLGQLILLVGYNSFKLPESISNQPNEIAKNIARTIIYGIIWVSYLKRSSRVKTTFIEPYAASPSIENGLILSTELTTTDREENTNLSNTENQE